MSQQLTWPASERNKQPILEVLKTILPSRGLVLEIGSGTGQHTAYFSANFPSLTWQSSDMEPAHRDSISAWIQESGVDNAPEPLDLDTRATPWPVTAADAIININMLHVTPWSSCSSLFAGAGPVLAAGAPLFLYGPFMRGGQHTSDGNVIFDADLRRQNPEWGVRDLDHVEAAAEDNGFVIRDIIDMPANNFSVIFEQPAQ